MTNPHGLHARPAARLVQQVRGFDAQVDVRNRTTGSAWVPASSLSRVATLGALRGHEVEVRARGRAGARGARHVLALAARGFDETGPGGATVPSARTARPAAAAGTASPLPASPGIGIGPAWSMRVAPVDDPRRASRGPGRRVAPAPGGAGGRRGGTCSGSGPAPPATPARREAAIFDAHLLLLDDADLLGRRPRRGSTAAQAAAPAWSAAVAPDRGRSSPRSPTRTCRRRAADVRAVGDQVLRALLGRPAARRRTATGVLVAADLTPAEAAELDRDAGRRRRPRLRQPHRRTARSWPGRGASRRSSAPGPAVLDVAAGTPIALDGDTGEVVVDPPDDVLGAFRDRAAELARRRTRAARAASRARA